MEHKEAINILINVANLAQSKGVLSLSDAVIVSRAVGVLTPEQDNEQGPTPSPEQVNQMRAVTDEEAPKEKFKKKR